MGEAGPRVLDARLGTVLWQRIRLSAGIDIWTTQLTLFGGFCMNGVQHVIS